MLASDKFAFPSEMARALQSMQRVMATPPSRVRLGRRPRPRLLRTLSAIWMGMAFFTASCLLGPNFKTPQAPVADNWMEKADGSVKSDESETRDWWTAFNDPALTRLIELAYKQNLTVQTAGVRVLESRARLGMAIGEFYPQQQQAGATVSYNHIPVSLPYNLIKNTYWSDQFGLQAAWE